MEASRLPGFTEKFIKLRGEMSQEQFSKKIGLSRPTVGLYESGKRIPDAQTLKKIAVACGVSADYLLGLSEIPGNDPDMKSAQAFTGVSPDTLAFLNEYKDDEGGPEWKMIRMVEKLIEHPDILSALVAAETKAASIASSMDTDNSLLPDPWPHEWPEEEKRLHTVQGWETALDAALFNVSNNAVRFAERVLNVRGIREALSKEDRDLQEVLRESEQEG